MALIRVREKNTAEGVEPRILEVDETWLKRWPDDFEEAPEDAEPQQAAPTEPSSAPAAKTTSAGGSDGEQAARSRF